MDKAYLKSVLIYIVTAALSLFVVFYLFHQLDTTSNDPIGTLVLKNSQTDITAEVEGYIFASEKAYTTTRVFLPYFTNGALVSVGDDIAGVYDESFGDTVSEVDKINKKISLLKRASTLNGGLLDNTDYSGNQNAAYLALVNAAGSKDLSSLSDRAEAWFIAKSLKNLSINSKADYQKQIEALEAEKAELLRGISTETTYTASFTGMFFEGCDGYGDIFTDNVAEKGDFSQIQAAFDTIKEDNIPQQSGGRIMNSVWYYVVTLSTRELEGMTSGKEYDITFDRSGITAKMLFLRSISSFGSDTVYAVFTRNGIPDGFTPDRYQSASIRVSSHNGYTVPKSAIRYKDGVTGVYTLYVNKAYFKEVTVIGEKDGAYIISTVAPERPKEEKEPEIVGPMPLGPLPPPPKGYQKPDRTHDYVELYDTVITSGKGVEEGEYFKVG